MSARNPEDVSTAKRAKTRNPHRRNYQARFDNAFFTVYFDGKIRCVICRATLAEAKESNLQRHFKTHAATVERWGLTDLSQREMKYSELRGKLVNESSSSTLSLSTDSEPPKSVSRLSAQLTLSLLNCLFTSSILGIFYFSQ